MDIECYNTANNREKIINYFKQHASFPQAISMTNAFFKDPSTFDPTMTNDILAILEPRKPAGRKPLSQLQRYLKSASPTTNALYEKIARTYKPLYQWKDLDVDQFLWDSELTSQNTITTYLSMIRKLVELDCRDQHVNYTQLHPTQEVREYIDLKKLRSKTILKKEEMHFIRTELINLNPRPNYRDVVLFELAFIGLTANDIQELKREEIIEVLDQKGRVNRLNLKLYNKTVMLDANVEEDRLFINDILRAKRETDYCKQRFYEGRDPVEDLIPYVPSPYLIRGIDNGNAKPNVPVAQPSRLLQKQLIKIAKDVGHPILDLEHLSLEDIRRSRLIQLLAYDEEVRITDLQHWLNKRQRNDMIWLRPIAKKLLELK